MYCRHCGTELMDTAVACTKCGAPPATGKKYCPKCGAETAENAVVCLKCGASISSGASASMDVNLVLAIILQIVWPGAGYFLVGQKTKGITFCIATFVSVILVIVTCGFWGFIHMAYAVVLLIDAAILASKANKGETIEEWQFF